MIETNPDSIARGHQIDPLIKKFCYVISACLPNFFWCVNL